MQESQYEDNLTLEQQLTQANFGKLVENMSIEQSKGFLIEFHRSMIVRENYYKSILKNSWFSGL